MNLHDFASIAEIVGAFAIVITLVYLAIQTRLTRQVLFTREWQRCTGLGQQLSHPLERLRRL